MNRTTFAIILGLCSAVLLAFGGCCVSRTEKARKELLAYLENRYPDDNFVWDYDQSRGTAQADDFGFNIVARSENMPDAYIYVSRWHDKEGHEIYADNYMVHYLHDDIEAYMYEIAESIFGECKVYMKFEVDGLIRSSVTINSTAEDYLKSKPDCSFSVYLPPNGLKMDVAKEKLEELKDCLKERKIYNISGGIDIVTDANAYEKCNSYDGPNGSIYNRTYLENVGGFEIKDN